MRSLAVIAAILVASVHAQALAKEGLVDWAMNATIIDGCSCRMLCPCIFGSPATVGSAATHEHEGHRSCYFNAAFRINKGHYGKVKLDGLKFWFAGDKGDARIVELTFEPSATKEQREGIREFLSHFLPLKWESFTEGPDAKIETLEAARTGDKYVHVVPETRRAGLVEMDKVLAIGKMLRSSIVDGSQRAKSARSFLSSVNESLSVG